MDWRILIPIIAVLVLLVAMGKNPFEPPPGWKPTDPFQQGIEDKLQTQSFGSYSSGTPALSGSATPLGAVEEVYPATAGGSGEAVHNYGNTSTEGYGGMLGGSGQGTTPSIVAPATELPSLPQTAPSNTPSGQPGPFQALPMPGGQSSLTPSQGGGNAERRPFLAAPALKDGTPVLFSGPQVYTKNASGQRVPMADGEYAMNDGLTLIVRGGKRQLPPYYFERMREEGNS